MDIDIKMISPLSVVINNNKYKPSPSTGSRRIYIHDNYIIKAGFMSDSMGRYSMAQCREEVELWEKIDEQDRKYFVPIIGHKFTQKYCYVIQPLLNFKRVYYKTRVKYFKNIVEPLANKYDRCDISEDWNWAFLDNHMPAIYDYGT
jgi:hypothetical protein